MTNATRHLVNKNEIDILAVPEFKYDAKHSPIEATICYNQGIRLLYTKHTATYCRLQTIAPTIQEHQVVHDGRAQFLVCKLADTYHIFIIAYGYQVGIDPNKNEGPKNLSEDILRMRHELMRKYPRAEWHMLGDLQTTVHPDEGYDPTLHRVGKKQKRREYNLYDLSHKVLKCKSAFPALYPDKPYITRVGAPTDKDGKRIKATGAGVDHCMVPEHFLHLNRILHAGIEDLNCKNYTWTDHHLVYTDFDSGTYLEPYPDTPYTKFLFRSITGIPVKWNDKDKVKWYEYRASTTNTKGNNKQRNLYDAVQKAAKSDPIQAKLKQITELLNEAELDLHEVTTALHEEENVTPDQLPPRTPLQKRNINLAYNLLVEICEDICDITNLSYKTTLNTEIQKSIDNFERTYTGPLGADDSTYKPFTSLINQIKSAHGLAETAHHIFGPFATWPTLKKRKTLSNSMLKLRVCLENLLEAAELYDTERSAEKQADKEAKIDADITAS